MQGPASEFPPCHPAHLFLKMSGAMRQNARSQNETVSATHLRSIAMGAALGVQAGVGDAQPLDRPSADQMLVHDRGGVFGLDIAVPDGLGIDDHRGPMLALIEASRLVDAHGCAQAGSFCQLLQLGVEFAFAIAGARWRGAPSGRTLWQTKT